LASRTAVSGRRCTIAVMADPIRILAVEKDDDYGLIVTFSDGTIGAYVVEELLELRPYREPINMKDHLG
jgi:hypothetical protein